MGVQRVTGDLRHPNSFKEAVTGVQCIFHLAAATAPQSLAESRAVNVEGTRQLAQQAAAQQTPPVFVYVSSLAAAGPHQDAVAETGACHPVSAYGRGKLEAEQALGDLARQMPITIVRPPCVFGPGDRNLLRLFKMVRRGWDFYSGSEFRYSFLHADDLVGGLLAAWQRGRRLRDPSDPRRQGLYYLADPQAVTFPELTRLLADALGRASVRHVRVPRWTGFVAAAMGDIVQRLTRRRVYFNIDKAREAYGGSWMCDASLRTGAA